MSLRILLTVELVLELDLDADDARMETAWWSWKGRTFAEAVIGRA